jgi:hypothetical protein
LPRKRGLKQCAFDERKLIEFETVTRFDRVAAQIEEIIANSHLLDRQRLLPLIDEKLFQLHDRRRIIFF